MIKCTDRLPSWDDLDGESLVVVRLKEIDIDTLLPTENGKELYTTAKISLGHYSDNVYFSFYDVWGDEYELLYKDVEPDDSSKDLYLTVRANYISWSRRKETHFIIDSWTPINEFSKEAADD